MDDLTDRAAYKTCPRACSEHHTFRRPCLLAPSRRQRLLAWLARVADVLDPAPKRPAEGMGGRTDD